MDPDETAGPRTPRPLEALAPGRAPSVVWWRGAAIAAVAVAGGLGLLGAVSLLARPLLLLVVAIAIAETLRPIARRLESILPRPLAVAAVYAALAAAVVGIALAIVPTTIDQGSRLARDAPALVADARESVDRWSGGNGDRLAEIVQGRVSGFGSGVAELPVRVASSVLDLVLVLVLSIYWLLTGPALHRFARSLVPPERRRRFDAVLEEMGRAVGGYLRGEAITAVLVAAIVFAGLSIIGVRFAVVLALIAGVGELVPVVGPILAGVPAVAVALLDSPTTAGIVLVFYLVLQQVESNVLLPIIQRRESGTPPLLALFAFFAGEAALGILGAVAAIPIAAALRVVVLRVVAPAVRSWTGAPEPAEGEA